MLWYNEKMINNSLKIVFYILMCIPVLVIGVYFFALMVKDISVMANEEKMKRDSRAAAQESRRKFDREYEGKHKNV